MDMDTVRLLPRHLKMEETIDILMFTIKDWILEYRNTSSPQDGVKMTLLLKRKIMNEMMTTYEALSG